MAWHTSSLYVGDLDLNVTENLLFEHFNRVGPVQSIRVCRDTVTRRSLGYAYVNFANVQDAERALECVNFTEIKGKPCRIMWSQRDPSMRRSGVGNIFIKNLAPTVDDKGLLDTFSVFGNILSCKIARDEHGVSKGYGFVHYENREAAEEAINKFQKHFIEDREVIVTNYNPRKKDKNNTFTNLYVKHFPENWTDEKLREIFSPYGEIKSTRVELDRNTNLSKCFGFVNFTEHASAEAAVKELHNKPIEGDDGAPLTHNLYVVRHETRVERKRDLEKKQLLRSTDRAMQTQGKNLYVKNIDDTISDEQLNIFFSPHGSITSAKIMRNEDGSSKGFGFVCYNDPIEATAAITELHGKMFGNKPITVTLHQPKTIRQQFLANNRNTRGAAPYGGHEPYVASMPYVDGYGASQGRRDPHYAFMPRPNSPRMVPGGRGQAQGGYYVQQPGFMQPQIPPQGYNIAPPRVAMIQQQQHMGQRGQVQGGRGQGPSMGGGAGQGGRVHTIPQSRTQVSGPGNVANNARSNPVRAAQGQVDSNNAQPSNAPSNFAETLSRLDPQNQKQRIGEELYKLIHPHQPGLAGKITGMLLEMDPSELINLIETKDALTSKIDEAINVLRQHGITD